MKIPEPIIERMRKGLREGSFLLLIMEEKKRADAALNA
jgi:hypothetical protein